MCSSIPSKSRYARVVHQPGAAVTAAAAFAPLPGLCCTMLTFLALATTAQHAPSIPIAAPLPPSPMLPAGLRALLEDTGCVGSCRERGSDWFERERPNLGMISTVAAMVQARLEEEFLASLALEPSAEAIVRRRLEALAREPIVPRDEL